MQNYEAKLIDSSRIVADILTADILGDQSKFDEMFNIALKNEDPISMRAARIIDLVAYKDKNLILSHLDEVIDAIETSKSEGVRRSFLKIFAELQIPLNETHEGKMADLAFNFVANKKEAIAIRYYSIEILLKVVRNYPELKNELAYVLEEITKESSAGLRSKSIKTLAALKKLK